MWIRSFENGVSNGVIQAKSMDLSGYLSKAKLSVISDNLHVWTPIFIPDKNGIIEELDKKRARREKDRLRKKQK